MKKNGRGLHGDRIQMTPRWRRSRSTGGGDAKRGTFTLGQKMDVQDHFQLNFICRWPCVFTRSENAVTKMLFSGIMSTTKATNLVKEMLKGRYFKG